MGRWKRNKQKEEQKSQEPKVSEGEGLKGIKEVLPSSKLQIPQATSVTVGKGAHSLSEMAKQFEAIDPNASLHQLVATTSPIHETLQAMASVGDIMSPMLAYNLPNTAEALSNLGTIANLKMTFPDSSLFGVVDEKQKPRDVDDILTQQKRLNTKMDELSLRLKKIEEKEADLDRKIQEYSSLKDKLTSMEGEFNDLGGKVDTVAEKIDSSTLKSIEIISVFVAVFTFITIDVSILKTQDLGIFDAVGLITLSAALLMLFSILIDILLRVWMPNSARDNRYAKMATKDFYWVIIALFLGSAICLSVPHLNPGKSEGEQSDLKVEEGG